jgi:hypothetical protein
MMKHALVLLQGRERIFHQRDPKIPPEAQEVHYLLRQKTQDAAGEGIGVSTFRK